MASQLNSRRSWVITIIVSLALVVLWYLTPYYRGMLMAHIDHDQGLFRVKAFGEPPPEKYGLYVRLLEERYGVEVEEVGSCCIPEGLRWYAEGYNAVSRRLLLDKYRRDIFLECWSLADQK